MAALLLLGVLIAGGVYYLREQRRGDARVQQVASDVRRLELEIKFRAATKGAELNNRGWPVSVEPGWFAQRPPENPLLPADHPWVEIAGKDEESLMHPPGRMAADQHDAAFWYNPAQGVVRARVPVMINDSDATALYNRVNATDLPSIFWTEPRRAVASTSTKKDAKSAPASPPEPLVVVHNGPSPAALPDAKAAPKPE